MSWDGIVNVLLFYHSFFLSVPIGGALHAVLNEK